MSKTVKGRLALLSKTSTEFQQLNPVLFKGELAYETDTKKVKFGDGVTNYNDLGYFADFEDFQEALTYTNSTEMMIAVGGYPKGTSFDNQTIAQVFDGLFYPYVAPSISSSGTPNGGTYEIGNDQTISNVRVTVTKGSRNITNVEVFNGDSSLGSKTDAVADGGTFNFTVSVPVPSGQNIRLTAKCTDSDSKTYQSTTGSFTWIYPFFHGVSDKAAAEFTGSDVTAMTKDLSSKGQKSYSYTTNNNKAVIAYPKSYGLLTKITDGSGVTDYTNSFGSPATVSVTSTSPAWGPVDYYVYTSGNATATSFQYKFNF